MKLIAHKLKNKLVEVRPKKDQQLYIWEQVWEAGMNTYL